VDEGLYTVGEPSEFDVTEGEERGYIEEDRVAPGNLRLVAMEGDDAGVGMVRASAGPYKRTGHFADTDPLWVNVSWRRLAVAGGLLSALVSRARDHAGIEKLGLPVFSTSEAAIRLYRRNGFAVEGRYPRDIKLADGTCADTVAMGLMVKERSRAPRA
jgi:ribosomal protein S18 acetylase RimI-like enzyme